jgi:hypothetical protein
MENKNSEKNLVTIGDNIESNGELSESMAYSYHCVFDSCGFSTLNYKLLCDHMEVTHIDNNIERVSDLTIKLSQQFMNKSIHSQPIDSLTVDSIHIKLNDRENQLTFDERVDDFNQNGCDFVEQNEDKVSEDFGVEPNEEMDHKFDDNNEIISGNSYTCTFTDCNYLGQTSDGLRTHLLNKHNINGKVYVEIKDNIADKIDIIKEPNRMRGRSNRCYVQNCGYVAKNSHGLRIHLLGKHKIRHSIETVVKPSNDEINGIKRKMIVLTNKPFTCSQPKCEYVGRNYHGLRIHYFRKHGMFVDFKTEFVEKPINKPNNDKIEVRETAKEQLQKVESIDNENKNFKCQVKDCECTFLKLISLRSHMVRKHRLFFTNDGKQSEKKDKNQRKVFKCKQNDCEYIGRTALGLRVHMKQRHGIRIRTNSIDPTTVVSTDKVVKNVENGENNSLKCPISHCEYVAKSLVGLRFHKHNKHKLKHRFRSLQSRFTQTKANPRTEALERLREGLKRKYAIRANPDKDQNQLSYRMKRKYTKRSDLNNQKLNKSVNSTKRPDNRRVDKVLNRVTVPTKRKYTRRVSNNQVINEDISQITQTIKRKYTRRVDNQVINRIDIPIKRKYTRRIVNNESVKQDINQTSHIIKRKYTRRNINGQDINRSTNLIVNQQDINRKLVTRVKRKYTRRVINSNRDNSNGFKGRYRRNMFTDSNQMNKISLEINNKCSRPSIGQHLTPIIKPNVNLNAKRKFKCQFPKCGYMAIDGEQLKTHVQCVHKSGGNVVNCPQSPNLFRCYFPDCGFIGYASQVLREHIASQHNFEQQVLHNNSNFKLYKCKFDNCFYAGSLTLKGLRNHIRRNHTNFAISPRRPKVGNRFDINYAINPQKRNTHFDEQSFQRQSTSNRNVMVFKCSFIDCSFSVSNLVDLRKHISRVHQN